jgi:hypothetical protein
VTTEPPPVVSIDPDGRGAWEVVLPESRDHVFCATLEDARRVAYGGVASRRPCELIVRDAYHRVIKREVIGTDWRREGASSAGS